MAIHHGLLEEVDARSVEHPRHGERLRRRKATSREVRHIQLHSMVNPGPQAARARRTTSDRWYRRRMGRRSAWVMEIPRQSGRCPIVGAAPSVPAGPVLRGLFRAMYPYDADVIWVHRWLEPLLPPGRQDRGPPVRGTSRRPGRARGSGARPRPSTMLVRITRSSSLAWEISAPSSSASLRVRPTPTEFVLYYDV